MSSSSISENVLAVLGMYDNNIQFITYLLYPIDSKLQNWRHINCFHKIQDIDIIFPTQFTTTLKCLCSIFYTTLKGIIQTQNSKHITDNTQEENKKKKTNGPQTTEQSNDSE